MVKVKDSLISTIPTTTSSSTLSVPNHQFIKSIVNSHVRKHKKKDPGVPKRALSAYMYFSKHTRDKIKDENPSMTFTDIGKELGLRWRALNEDEKLVFIDMANQDKIRFENDKSIYDTNMMKKKAENDEILRKQAIEADKIRQKEYQDKVNQKHQLQIQHQLQQQQHQQQFYNQNPQQQQQQQPQSSFQSINAPQNHYSQFQNLNLFNQPKSQPMYYGIGSNPNQSNPASNNNAPYYNPYSLQMAQNPSSFDHLKDENHQFHDHDNQFNSQLPVSNVSIQEQKQKQWQQHVQAQQFWQPDYLNHEAV